MNNDIGYGASAIKAGETRYQQAVVNLLKDAAKKPEVAAVSATPEHVGKTVDVKA